MHRPGNITPAKSTDSSSYAPGWERTVVARPLAVAVSVVFFAGLLAVPLVDAWRGSWGAPARAARDGAASVLRACSGDGAWWERLIRANRAAVAGIQSFESSVEDASATAASVRPAILDLLLRYGGAGSEKAYVGREGWLFYRPDVDALLQRGGVSPAAARGIAGFAADLAARGVRLVFMPVPGKASIHPEFLASKADFAAPLLPDGWGTLPQDVQRAWEEEVSARGLRDAPAPVVFDPSTLLWARKSSGVPQFLATDSHWSPGAMEAVASSLADFLAAECAVPRVTSDAPATPVQVTGLGDTARMLELPEESPLRRKQTVTTHPAGRPEDGLRLPGSAADVLVLGDSYSNIYSVGELGWGGSAGLSEQLSRFLGRSVDRVSRNDAGAGEARRMLALQDADRLRGKSVVVWQLAARELVSGDWSPVVWNGGSGAARRFFVAPAGDPVEVTAEVVATGRVPEPGQTPYADYLTAVHLGDLRDAASGKALDGEALAYVFTMRDHRPVPAAGLSPGSRVRVRLANYAERSAMLDPLNRGEIDDPELMLETPNFAEWLLPSDS